MLINKQGKNVTKLISNLEKENPKKYKRDREFILSNVSEILIPDNHHQDDMFTIGKRANLK